MKIKLILLFKMYPQLEARLPYVSLGEFPTPVQKLEQIGNEIGTDKLYIKRDDISSRVYGGNKTRKLEFLLADALHSGVKEVITFGGAGSNHALATAIFSKQLGLKSISMLLPQPNARYVRRNLLMSYKYGAEIHSCGAELNSPMCMPLVYLATTYQLLIHKLKTGHFPRIIPPGGSSPLGALGFVNAAFELKEQVISGDIPEPDCIYVATGTMGTAAGLILGLKAAQLKSQVVSVRVTNEKLVNVKAMLELVRKINSLLSSLDPSFPDLPFSKDDVTIRHNFFGQQYALYTNEGMEAVTLMDRTEGIKLDGTYTGKTFASIIHDSRSQDLKNKVVLFWNTLNSRDYTDAIANVDYHELPRGLHRYFQEDVQPLDRV